MKPLTKKFPFHKQETKYTCGAAAMRMVLEFCGIKKSEKQVVKLLGTNKVRGTWLKDFPRLAEKYKLKYVVKSNSTTNDLKKLQRQGYIILICYYHPPQKVDHYSVLRKIDSENIYFWDPWYGPEHKYTLRYFRRIWKSDPKYEKEKAWFIAMER